MMTGNSGNFFQTDSFGFDNWKAVKVITNNTMERGYRFIVYP